MTKKLALAILVVFVTEAPSLVYAQSPSVAQQWNAINKARVWRVASPKPPALARKSAPKKRVIAARPRSYKTAAPVAAVRTRHSYTRRRQIAYVASERRTERKKRFRPVTAIKRLIRDILD